MTAIPSFYRAVATDPPTEADFLSNAALGNVLRPPMTPVRLRLWEGISVFDSEESARDRAARLRPPRPVTAVLHVPADGPVTFAKTLRDEAHYTLWGSPADMLQCVESVRAARV